ncbi:hypothetical protein B5X24_HaOG207343 [Helicoverpa armigera]|uniref:Uncharacterized protein n=1 Tax=Helicoverpa armigera TaxID=29058 RepID=A0A2W1BM33_HELAM|nr:hypothetical protein B5X24_HaOG207343 [Helicoverpa armigera]
MPVVGRVAYELPHLLVVSASRTDVKSCVWNEPMHLKQGNGFKLLADKTVENSSFTYVVDMTLFTVYKKVYVMFIMSERK